MLKIVWKVWTTEKKPIFQLGFCTLVKILYCIMSTRLVLAINNAISDYEHIEKGLVMVGVCLLGMFVFGCAQELLRKYSLYNAYIANCNKLADKVVDSDIDLFVKYSCAHIHTMQSAIAEILRAGESIMYMIVNVVYIILVLESAFEIGGWIAFPIVAIYGLAIILAKVLYPIFGKMSKKIAMVTKIRNQELENMIYGFMEVRSFQTQKTHKKAIRDLNEMRNIESRKKAKIGVLINGGFEVIDGIAILVALMLVSNSIISGTMSPTDGITIVMLIYKIIDPLVSILDFMHEFTDYTKHAVDFDAIMNYKDPIPDGNLTLSKFEKGIEIKDVSFAYGDASNTLENISIEIKKGERVGICGESGGGKTTIFKLLNKLYKPQSGAILIDGTNIWNISNDSYRKFLGSVHQENTMFPGTIWKNVTYGSESVLETQVVEACKKAHIYDFIMSLPNRFETEIGPRGLILSTGQKQRIALARLLLVDPEIILLDEATSALDNESEAFIQDAIDNLEGKTIITIAHRLSTIWNSDQIYVIGNHGVAEHGTHDELMASHGIYYKMNKQKGGTS